MTRPVAQTAIQNVSYVAQPANENVSCVGLRDISLVQLISWSTVLSLSLSKQLILTCNQSRGSHHCGRCRGDGCGGDGGGEGGRKREGVRVGEGMGWGEELNYRHLFINTI